MAVIVYGNDQYISPYTVATFIWGGHSYLLTREMLYCRELACLTIFILL